MAGTIEKRLASIGVTLPTPASPIANYVPFVRSGNMLVVSGQICFGGDGKLVAKGPARRMPSLSRMDRKRHGPAPSTYWRSSRQPWAISTRSPESSVWADLSIQPSGFVDGPKVMNGASDLMVEVFGDKGRHARTTVGVSALPGDAAVEVEGIFEIASA